MSSLNQCIKTLLREGAISQSMADDVKEAARILIKDDGYTAKDAAKEAVENALDDLNVELKGIYAQIGYEPQEAGQSNNDKETQAVENEQETETVLRENAAQDDNQSRNPETPSLNAREYSDPAGAQKIIESINEGQSLVDTGRDTAGEKLTPEKRGQIQRSIASAKNKLAAMPPRESAEQQTAPIEDFGQKIEGARKDFASKMAEAKEKNIAAVPLSESWPEPDYQKLIDMGADPVAVGFARSIREEMPNKPRSSWKLKGWTEKVGSSRDIAESVIAGDIDIAELRQKFSESGLRASNRQADQMFGRADLYAEFGHDKSLKGIKFYEAHFSLLKTGDKLEKDVTKWLIERPAGASNPFSNMPYTLASADTKQAAIEQFRKLYSDLDNKKKTNPVRFDIYTSRRDKSDVFIGKKIGSDLVRIEQGFKNVAEARTYLKENQNALEEKLNRMKEVPAMRRETNNPRVGIDHRNGGDVTPEQFADALGFRGVQFGNYVEQGRRQDDLNDAYDALMDLAGILNIPPKALSLNGELGLAFGARGKGGKRPAAAHYEAGNIVINLTKKSGAGSLAHEWWHSLDNYFSRKGGVASNFVTENPYQKRDGVRPEVIDAFKAVNAAINRTMLSQRSAKLDQTRTKPYWSTNIEMSARSFESYVIEKLRDQNVSNDYLANIVSEDYWNAAAKLGIEKDGTYPYPEAAEVPEIRGAFDNFLEVVETRETDSGIELYSFAGQQSNTADRLQLDRALAMEADGRDRDMIRKETGWFRGEDGKLRYEISDDKASLNEIAGTSERVEAPLIAALNHPALFEAYPDLQNITVFQRPKPRGETYRGVFYEQDNLIELDSALTDTEKLSVLLHEVQHAIQAREDFARGGNSDARFTDSVRQTVSRMSDMERIRIDLWKGANDDLLAEAEQAAEMARYALMYESMTRLVEHANRERPSSQLRNLRNEMQWIYQYGQRDQEASDIEREWYALPKRHKMRERNEFLRDLSMRGANYLRDKIPNNVRRQFESDPRQQKSMIKALQREAAVANQQLQPLRNQERRFMAASALADATEFKSPHDIYRALSGEIEARNVQARQNMTDQERQDVSPERTRDVPRGEAIIVFGGLEMAVPMASQDAAMTRQAATTELSKDRLLKRAIDSGKLKVVQSVKELPKKAKLKSEQQPDRNTKLEIKRLLSESPTNKRNAVDYLPVSGAEASQARENGLNIDGFVHEIDTFAVQHIRRQHGDSKKEASRGQIAVTDSDFEMLPEIISQPDQVAYGLKNNRGQDQIAYLKRLADGSVLVIEEVRTGRNKLAVASMRKYPAANNALSIDSVVLNAQNDGRNLSVIKNPTGRNAYQSQSAGAIQGAYKDGTAYIVADGNTQGTLKQTAFHELTHAALDTKGDTFIQPAQKEKLFKRLDAQVKLARNAKGDSPLKRAIKRTEQAGTSPEKYMEEIAGYLVTDYVNDPSTLTGAIRQWVQDFIGAIQAAVLRYSGVQIGKVTGAELNAIARAYADYVTLPDRGRNNAGVTAGGPALSSRSAMKSVGANVSRGAQSMNNALIDKADVKRAMYHNELGWIDFVWGDQKKGISHIIKSRMERDGQSVNDVYRLLTVDLVNTIAMGEVIRKSEFENSMRLAITFDGSEAVLVRKKGGNGWLLTGFKVNEQMNQGGSVTAPDLRSTEPTPSRFSEGAAQKQLSDLAAENVNTENQNAAGTYSDNILFSRAPAAETMGPSNFAAPEETLVRSVIRKFQDKFKVLKDLEANIKESGGTIDESNDAYRAEELFHGKAENDIRLMKEQFVEPMAAMMAKFDIDQEALDQYLIAKHAPERNRQIAKINPAMPDGGSGMTNAEAKALIAEIESNGKLEQYEQTAGLVYELLQTQRDMIRSAGLESDGLLDTWEESYQFYVPLKGWKDETEGEGMPISGSGFNIGGRESRRAMGRSSEAASPSSFAISDTTKVIIRKRKNEVGNALLKMIEDNPNKDYWQIFTEDNPDTDRRIVRVKDPETGKMVDQVRETVIPMAMMRDRYFTTKKDGETFYMKLEDPRLMTAMKNLGPETIGVVIRTLGGINRILSSLNTSYSPEFVVSNFSRDIQTAILNLSAEQSLNPGDGKASGEKIAAKTVKNTPTAMRAIYASLRGKKLKGGAAQWQTWFDEFRADGAKTGYFDMKDLNGQSKELQTLISMAKGDIKGNALRFGKSVAEFVENANQAVENAVRLSAYVNARQVGISRSQASSLAKNMTVNFNRRGEIGTLLNSLYMFANASIQGTANFARTMATLKGDKSIKWKNLNNAQKIAFGIMAGSFFMGMANRMAAGEDDDGENWYDKVPDYVKERNLVIMKSMFGGDQNGEYWKIPLPYGYNIFAVAGVSAEAITIGDKSPLEASGEMTLAALGSFSPIGFQESSTAHGAFLKNAAPTVIKPMVDISLNENFMGSSIYSENLPFGTPKPNSSLARRSTPLVYRELATWMNEVTGGSEFRPGAIDVNPDVFNYFLDYFGGSAFQFFGTKTPEFGIRTFAGIEFDENRTPFLSRISGRVMHYDDTDKFYNRRNEINQIDSERKSLSGAEQFRFSRENRDKLQLKSLVKRTETKLRSYRKERDAVYAADISLKMRDIRLKEIERKMKAAVDEFNRAYGSLE